MERDNIRTIYFFKKKIEKKEPSNKENKILIKLLEADLSYKLRRSSSDNDRRETMPKEIKIFIASQSILSEERDFVEKLIWRKNEDFFGKGIHLIPKRWENEDKGIGGERKQNEFNSILCDCEYMILLMWNNIGKYTKEEFELAYKNLKEGLKPYRIYAFNKGVERSPRDDEIDGIIAFFDLKKTLWKEERIIIPFSDNQVIQGELDNMFHEIESKYS